MMPFKKLLLLVKRVSQKTNWMESDIEDTEKNKIDNQLKLYSQKDMFSLKVFWFK